MILQNVRTNLKPASHILLVGGVIGTVVMAVGGGLGLTIGGVIGFAITTLASVVSTGIILYSVDLALRQFGVNTQRHRRRFKLALRRGINFIRRGVSVAGRTVRKSARIVYKQLKGGIR